LIKNVINVLPAGTLIDAGLIADELSLTSFTLMPPRGAGAVSVTFPREVRPPTTFDGVIVTVDRLGGSNVSVAVPVELPIEAVMVDVTWVETATVRIMNVAEVFPRATRILAGGVALFRLLTSLTVTPPTGAGPVKLTVPVEIPPPGTLDGLRLTEAMVARTTFKTVLRETVFSLAVMVASCSAVTTVVVAVKLTEVCPAGTITNVGTVTYFVLLLLRET
jgi:hypothetical protein